MVFENIEKLKAEYTDKFVRVDADQPELARFKGFVGQVKTVNMSGRALVEFGGFYENIGWHDIELDFLRVVDAPTEAEGVAKAQPAAKQVVRSAAAADQKQPPQPAAAPQQQAATTAAPGAAVASDAPRLAESAADVDRSKMSVADILAQARAEKTGGAPTAPPQAPSAAQPKAAAAPAAKSQAAPAKVPEPEPEPEAAAESQPEVPPAAPTSSGGFDRSSMSVADMVAYCKEHDSG